MVLFGSENQSVSGSTLLSSADINSGPDYALLEMTSNIPDSYNPYYGLVKSNLATARCFVFIIQVRD